MAIAVTAASGKLGREIIHALGRAAPEQIVVGLARTVANAADLGVEVRPGDDDDRPGLTASLDGVDTLLLVSGNDAPEARIQQHRNVLNPASAAGVSKFVYTSVQGAEEGMALSPIVLSNRQTERDVCKSTMPHRSWTEVFARP
jgi:NAD(P)H dehydrogenase (quinone)